jgi:hypothetical protein
MCILSENPNPVSFAKKKRPDSQPNRIDAYPGKHEKLFIITICLIAAIRIFLFSAAFPFFNNVDEQAHFDLVVKYSHGYLPRSTNNLLSPESSRAITLYGTYEYLNNIPTSEAMPPIWTLDTEIQNLLVKDLEVQWTSRNNFETTSAPVYYFTAGMWYNAGKLLGLEGGYLLYWIRFLNIGIFVLLVWLTWLFCKNILGMNPGLRISVPLLLVFFPQDVFYTINSDVLSPLLFLTSLYMLYSVTISKKNMRYYFYTGIVIALTYLTKLSNLPILAVTIIILCAKTRQLLKENGPGKQVLSLIVLILAFTVPIACWHGWNAYALNDPTGTVEKIKHLQWTPKPPSQMWDHPIFTPAGAAYFLSELTKTFWRGELVWKLQRLAWQSMDLFYVFSSLLFLSVAIGGRFLKKISAFSSQKLFYHMNQFIVLLFVLFLGSLSTLYDFGNCWYPSRAHPYFTSGRLILGAMIPFLVLYVEGLNCIVKTIKGCISPIIPVFLISALITGTEIMINYKVFASDFNWFHLF